MKGKRLTIKNTEELRTRLKVERDGNVKIKLIFLKLMADLRVGLEKVCEPCGIATSTGYSWIRKWNQRRYEGIKSKKGKAGRPSRLSEDDLDKLREFLKEKEYWTTKEVRELIKERFGVELLCVIQRKLHENNIDFSWKTIRKLMSSHARITISMTTNNRRTIYIRLTSQAEDFHIGSFIEISASY